MQAAVWYGQRDIRIEEVAEPEPGPGQVLVQVARNGICGSDLHTYVGSSAAALHVPGVVLGHEFAGTVRAVGTDVDDVTVGTPVAIAPIEWCGACWACTNGHPNLCRKLALYGGYRLPLHGGLAPLVAVSRRSVFEVPEGLGVVEAALAEPVAVAVHAVRLAPARFGASVVVLGGGPIGLGVLQAAVAGGRRAHDRVGAVRSASRGRAGVRRDRGVGSAHRRPRGRGARPHRTRRRSRVRHHRRQRRARSGHHCVAPGRNARERRAVGRARAGRHGSRDGEGDRPSLLVHL